MDSSLQNDLASLQLSNCVSLVIVTAIAYDYILTFSREMEYIWNKPWSLVSTLFVIVRYLGLCGFMMDCFLGTSFLPGPAKLCGVLEIITLWAIFIYICAADLMMILRIWAMYNRSKIILGILLTSYLGEIIPSTIASVVYSNPKSFVVIVNQLLDLSFCSLGAISASWNKATSLSQLVHAGVMCTLVVIQFTARSAQMYRATKQWQLGPFVNLLIVEGVVYFLAILMWNLVNTLYAFGHLSGDGPSYVVLSLLEVIPIATLTPRFILSMRELYARSVHGGRADNIDTGFGLATLSDPGMSGSTMVFAESEGNGGSNHGESIAMKTGPEIR